MCTFHNRIKIFGIIVHIVLLSIAPDSITDLILLFGRNDVLRDINVRDLRLLQPRDEASPSSPLNIVRLAEIQAPNLTFRPLKNFGQMLYLVIAHPLVKILLNT